MYYVDIAYIYFIFNTVNHCDPFCLTHRSMHKTRLKTSRLSVNKVDVWVTMQLVHSSTAG